MVRRTPDKKEITSLFLSFLLGMIFQSIVKVFPDKMESD